MMLTWHEMLIESFEHQLIEMIPKFFQPVEIVDGYVVDELVNDFVRLA